MYGMYPFTLDPAKPDGPTWLESQGYPVVQHDGDFFAGTPDAESLIAGYDALGAAKAAAKGRVKEEAGRRIYAIAPDTVQRNSLARTSELLLGLITGGLSADEQAELAAIHGLWNRVKALRDASDAIEADVDALDEWHAVNAFDAAASARWPE